MKSLLILAFAATLVGCTAPMTTNKRLAKGADGRLYPPLSIRAERVLHLGDTLDIVNEDPNSPVEVVFSNESALDEKVVFTIESGLKSKQLKLDASTLPGFDPASPVQTFEVAASTGNRSISLTFSVVPEDVMAFPSVAYQLGGSMPPGKSPWVPAGDRVGADALADTFVSTVRGEQVTVSSKRIAQSALDVPSHMGQIPERIPVLEYTVSGRFQKFLFPKELSPMGKASVITPTSFKLWITQSEPAQLITFTPIP